MKRKVNLVGHNTLTVSLPTKWVQIHKIKKGDEIDIIEQDDNIIISKSYALGKNEKSISLELNHDDSTYIRSLLGSLYRKGYDKITLKHPNSSVYKKIEEATNSLMGYELVDFGINQCTIKNMVVEESSEFESTFRKMIYNLKTMNELLIEDIRSKKFDKIEEFKSMRINIWKLRDYVLRLITKKNLFREDNVNHSILVWTVEKITDQYRKIYEVLLKEPKRDYSKLIPILQKFGEMADLMDKAYFKKDFTLIPKFDELRKEIRDKCIAQFSTNKNYDLIVAYILENSKRVHDMKSFIVSIILDSQQNILDGTMP